MNLQQLFASLAQAAFGNLTGDVELRKDLAIYLATGEASDRVKQFIGQQAGPGAVGDPTGLWNAFTQQGQQGQQVRAQGQLAGAPTLSAGGTQARQVAEIAQPGQALQDNPPLQGVQRVNPAQVAGNQVRQQALQTPSPGGLSSQVGTPGGAGVAGFPGGADPGVGNRQTAGEMLFEDPQQATRYMLQQAGYSADKPGILSNFVADRLGNRLNASLALNQFQSDATGGFFDPAQAVDIAGGYARGGQPSLQATRQNAQDILNSPDVQAMIADMTPAELQQFMKNNQYLLFAGSGTLGRNIQSRRLQQGMNQYGDSELQAALSGGTGGTAGEYLAQVQDPRIRRAFGLR